jgi:hypothetical protein
MMGRPSRNLLGEGRFLTIFQTPEKSVEVFAATLDLQPKRRLFLVGERHLKHIPPISNDGGAQERKFLISRSASIVVPGYPIVAASPIGALASATIQQPES